MRVLLEPKRPLLGAATFLLLAVCAQVFAGSWTEEVRDNAGNVRLRILSMDLVEKALNQKDIPNPKGPYMVLACRNSTFSIAIDWRTSVGKLREKRRHLLYHVDGDSHLMLPVLDEAGRSTGYVDQSEKAKALVHEILATLTRDFIPIGVFPAGRDPVTGEWIDGWFPATAFRESTLTVGKACNFDPIDFNSSAHRVDKVAPAPPGGK